MMRILENVKLKPHILLIDWDGEYNTSKLIEYAEASGGYIKISSKTQLKKRVKNLSPVEWYNTFKKITGEALPNQLT
jgi:hypothetical protein